MAILYLETNFLLGVATGRYEGAELFGRCSPSLTIAVPRSCIMESFAAAEAIWARRKRFDRLLDQHIRRLCNDIRLPRSQEVAARLEAARFENSQLADDTRQRLLAVIQHLTSQALLIDEPTSLLSELVTTTTPVMEQMTDSLILSAVVSHASQTQDAPKALFTENASDFGDREAFRKLRGAGVRLITKFESALQWIAGPGASSAVDT